MLETEKHLSFWDQNRYKDRRELLRTRNRIRDHLRSHFSAQDFCEIDTAILQISPGNDAHISAFATLFEISHEGAQPYYLHTSPEFSCKKLLAAGEKRLMSFGHVFRNGERGPLHHPEFTMLEWYRAGEDYLVLFEDCANIVRVAAMIAKSARLSFRERQCDPFAPFEILSVCEAFSRYAQLNLVEFLPEEDEDDQTKLTAFMTAARDRNIRVNSDDNWSDLFSKLLSSYIEPNLGLGVPTILYEYPLSEAALARPKPTDCRFAERFELYACGVELANGFGELIDKRIQRRRFEKAMLDRERIYGHSYPIDEDFLRALDFMPPASGCALGFDRLIMLVTHAPHIVDVLWTPVA